MRSYSIHEARTRFAEVIDRALKGEPQRVTRYGKDAVVVVSETEWNKHGSAKAGNLGAALLRLGAAGAFDEDVIERPDWMRNSRELGHDFT